MTTIVKHDDSTLHIDCSGLPESTVRLIRSLNGLLTTILVTESEKEFFDGSAELLRGCAMIVKKAKFAKKKTSVNIAYSEQAIEFAIEQLLERIEQAKIMQYDN